MLGFHMAKEYKLRVVRLIGFSGAHLELKCTSIDSPDSEKIKELLKKHHACLGVYEIRLWGSVTSVVRDLCSLSEQLWQQGFGLEITGETCPDLVNRLHYWGARRDYNDLTDDIFLQALSYVGVRIIVSPSLHRECCKLVGNPVPWGDKIWAIHNTQRHCTYLSQEYPGKIAYTARSADFAKDRQVVIRPGRYLRRFFSDVLTNDEIQSWATQVPGPQELHFAATPKDIALVYRKGPNSCMSYDFSSLPHHPAEVYGDSDLQVAYLTDGDRITARCLVWPAQQRYGVIYGDVCRLERALQDAGYNEGSFAGARIRKIECKDNYVMPYLDCDYGVSSDGDYWEIREGGYGEHWAQGTSGLLYDGYYCESCETYNHDELTTVNGEGEWCSSCVEASAVWCEICEFYYSDGCPDCCPRCETAGGCECCEWCGEPPECECCDKCAGPCECQSELFEEVGV